MLLFGSQRRDAGWTCINLLPDRVDVCRINVAAGARPEIVLCDSYRKEGGDVATLARLRRELRLGRQRCTTLLKAGEYQLAQVDTPEVPDSEVVQAVRGRLNGRLDYPLESAVVDAVYIPAAEVTTRRSPQMLAVAARDALVAATVKPFAEADVPLEVVDIPEFAQRNVARWLELPGRGLALLSFDERGALLTFSCYGELFRHHRLDLPVAMLAGASDGERQSFYEGLVPELQRLLEAFGHAFGYISVARLMVMPLPGAEDLREVLSARLDVPVALVHLSEIMDFPHVPELHEDARQAQCLHLIGAALREAAA